MKNKLSLKDLRGKRELRKQDLKRREFVLREKQRLPPTMLRSRPKDKEELLRPRLPVLSMNKEWKKRELKSKRELLLSKLREKLGSSNTKRSKRKSVWRERLKLKLLDSREKNNLKLIVSSRKLPKLNTLRGLRLRDSNVMLKWLNIRRRLRQEESKESLKSPNIKLSKKPDMLH